MEQDELGTENIDPGETTVDANIMNASESLYGFCSWLTTRRKLTVMSSQHNASPIADLIRLFREENNLPAPRDGWESNLTHPK